MGFWGSEKGGTLSVGKSSRKRNRLAGGSSLLKTRRLKKHGFRSQKARLKAYEKQEKIDIAKREKAKVKAVRGRKRIARKIWRKLI
jgi:signal transduction histidine kinase